MDFIIIPHLFSGVADILEYVQQHENSEQVNVPGFIEKCKVPSIDLLAAIRHSHLYYPVMWNTHINKYHELLQLTASSQPPKEQQKNFNKY